MKDEKLDSQRDIGISGRINTTCTIMEMTKRGYRTSDKVWEKICSVDDYSIITKEEDDKSDHDR